MALDGTAALAMWWDMAREVRDEFQHWHTHEHFAERLALPGFRRGSRWACADGGEGFFVLYELARHEDLASPEYLARLNAPTPWSTKLMPQHRNMVRSQCRVEASEGGTVARHALTLRFSPAAGAEEQLRKALQVQVRELAARPGLSGAHLLRTEAPAIAQTKEQAIRGGDRAADWVLLVCGYEREVLEGLVRHDLSAAALRSHGGGEDVQVALHELCLSMSRADVAPQSKRG